MIDLEIRQVSFSYFNGLVLKDINLSVKAGQIVGIIGPNGSGKTTLIKLASGVLRPLKGEVRLGNNDLATLKRSFIARNVATLPQQFHIPYAFTAGDVVTLGRTPFIKALAGETLADKQVIANAMEMVGIGNLSSRRFDELSGGERQKVILAMALAQEPKLLLLDEPTAHLDINHQVEILELVRNLNRKKGITVIAAMHDLNLASLYFDRLVLLKDGKIQESGTPAQVLTEENLGDVFSVSVRVEYYPESNIPHIIVMPKSSTIKRE